MIRHQKARAEGADDPHLCSFLKITQVIRRDAGNRIAVVVVGHALYGERDVVVARSLALARTRDRIEANVMWLAIRIGAGRNYADRLTLENGKRNRAEVEHDVPHVGRCSFAGEAI